mmetsp:Transcript_23741/g.69946  ORF Transcript_23741/g.69946 Transcript_23741/m.69946 type:complete len:435 (+) Transcript_23741:293-1597(+)
MPAHAHGLRAPGAGQPRGPGPPGGEHRGPAREDGDGSGRRRPRRGEHARSPELCRCPGERHPRAGNARKSRPDVGRAVRARRGAPRALRRDGGAPRQRHNPRGGLRCRARPRRGERGEPRGRGGGGLVPGGGCVTRAAHPEPTRGGGGGVHHGGAGSRARRGAIRPGHRRGLRAQPRGGGGGAPRQRGARKGGSELRRQPRAGGRQTGAVGAAPADGALRRGAHERPPRLRGCPGAGLRRPSQFGGDIGRAPPGGVGRRRAAVRGESHDGPRQERAPANMGLRRGGCDRPGRQRRQARSRRGQGGRRRHGRDNCAPRQRVGDGVGTPRHRHHLHGAPRGDPHRRGRARPLRPRPPHLAQEPADPGARHQGAHHHRQGEPRGPRRGALLGRGGADQNAAQAQPRGAEGAQARGRVPEDAGRAGQAGCHLAIMIDE